MSVRNSFFLFGTAVFLNSCAAINNPEGGPRDVTNPKLIASFPVDKSVNVSTQTIRLTFDEEVKIPNLNKQLQVSPNTDLKYSTKTDRNSVILTFDKPLEENTTYQFNFREGIEDITESNKAQDLKLTFSTGPSLDSAYISGEVKVLLTNAPEPTITVALYPETDTAGIRKNKPFYLTQASSAGTFQFTNIRAGNYWIFAHRDKNNNQIYDNENETIGYLPTVVKAAGTDTAQQAAIVLLTGKADTKKPFVFKKEPFTDNYAITYTEGIAAVNINPLSKTVKEIPFTVAQEGKVLRIFPTTAFKGDKLIITATDSSYNTGTDTVTVTFTGTRGFKDPGTYKLVNTTGSITTGQSVDIQFEVPLQEIKPDAFSLVEDTIRTRTLNQSEFKLSENKTMLTFTPKISAKDNISIVADSGKVISATGSPVKLLPVKLKVSDQLVVGSVSGLVKTAYKNYYLELLSANGQLIKSVKNPKTFEFNNLLPGIYSFRVKIDENNNGRWEGIKKDLKTKPEKIYHHKEPVEIRANWDIEDFILTF